MQRIVSIDIGVLNFAYAAADVHNGKVRVTKVRCIKICNSGLNIGESVNYLLAALGEKFNPDSWSTTIVIEQQLWRNLKAKCLSMTVQRFFRTFALARSLPLPHTVFMNAKDKFGFLKKHRELMHGYVNKGRCKELKFKSIFAVTNLLHREDLLDKEEGIADYFT